MDKKALRKRIAEQKRAMTPEQIEAASQRLAERLFQTDAYQNALSIYGYLSYNQEIRTLPILRRAMIDGKRVAVPKVYGDEMRFIWMDDLSLVAPGYYDIPEPIADGPVADDELALMLMPGLAFDPEGHRVGYGGGFYDRYLAAHPDHKLVALCYGFQLVDHLDCEAHDIPVHRVIPDEETRAVSLPDLAGSAR
ncbi:MAG TPA: 5-formyltetrahydrofolate cyclo-ligase [Candidatus Faecivicinus avistercoris]|nr:5-formyltetrahydrofolate cyclo-ligase [Candidatus Faecivicinus avistercoris]